MTDEAAVAEFGAVHRGPVIGPADVRFARARRSFNALIEALPELITFDDWGFPMVGDQAVPSRLLADARATTRACPKLALWLDRG